jgi:hypothetical protein
MTCRGLVEPREGSWFTVRTAMSYTQSTFV